MSSARRLLLVHAHPDDESIGTGATMAGYAAEGAQVTLVTCTLGDSARSSRRRWRTWPMGIPGVEPGWGSTASASCPRPAPSSA